jgi:TP901 family phage tail tape measure protein
MRTLAVNVRWADNTETLKQHLAEGLGGVKSFAQAFTQLSGAAGDALNASVNHLGRLQGALKAAEADVTRLEKAWRAATTPEAKSTLAADLGTATLGAKALADQLKIVKQQIVETLSQPVNLGNLKQADVQQRVFAQQAKEEERAAAARKKALESSAKAAEDAARRQTKAAEEAAKKEVKAAEDARQREMKALDNAFQHAVKVRDGQVKAAEDAAKKEAAALDAEFQKASRQRDQATENSIAKMRALPEQLRAIGYAATTFITVPLLGAATASIKFASDFEASMLKVSTLSNIPRGDIEDLKKSIRAMSAEVAIGANELAKAMLVVTSTGIQGKEALDVLRVAAKMSAVGMGETAEIARTLVAVMHAYANENMSAARAGEIMFKIVKDGAADADELGHTLGRVVGIAATLGVKLEDIGGFIAIFTRLGVSTAEATTAVRALIANLELGKETQPAIDALKSVNLTFDELRANIKDKGLVAAVQELFAAFKGREHDLQPLIPNIRAMSGAMGVFVAQGGDVAAIMAHIKAQTDEMNTAFADTSETAAFKFAQLTAKVNDLGIEIGNILLPHVVKLSEKLLEMAESGKKMAESFEKWPEPLKDLSLGLLAIFGAGGPVLIGMGMMARALTAINTLLFGAQKAAEFSLITQLAKWGPWLLRYGPLLIAAYHVFVESDEAQQKRLRTAELEDLPTGRIRRDLRLPAMPDLPKPPSILDVYGIKTGAPEAPEKLPTIDTTGLVQGAGFGSAAVATLLEKVKALTEAQRENIRVNYEAGLRGKQLAEAVGIESDVVEVFVRQMNKANSATDEYGRTLKAIAQAEKEAAAALIPLTEGQKKEADRLLGLGLGNDIIAKKLGVAISQVNQYTKMLDLSRSIELDGLKKSQEEWERWSKRVQEAADIVGKAIIENDRIMRDSMRRAEETQKRRELSALEFARYQVEQQRRVAHLGVTDTIKTRDVTTGQVTETPLPGARAAHEAIDAEFDQTIQDLFAKESVDAMVRAAHAAGLDAAKSFLTGFSDIVNSVPAAIFDAFTGGGGIQGAFKAIESSVGAQLGKALFSSVKFGGMLADGVGKLFGNKIGQSFATMLPGIGSAIGALAGPMIDMFIKLFDHTGRDIKRKAKQYGAEIGDAVADGIANTMKELKMTQQAATIFNIDKLFPKIDKSNVAQATRATRDIFSMIETGQFTVAQGAEALDKIFPKLAEAATDSYGFISDGLKEVIALNLRFGTQSKEIAAFLKAQGQAAVAASNAIIAGLTPQITKWKELADKIKDAKAGSQELADLHRERTAEAVAHGRELQDLGTIALATFGAAVASGASFSEALAAAAPGLNQLIEAFDSLGLSIDNAALNALLLQSRILKNAPQLLEAVSGLGKGFAALSNLGLMNVETFRAMERTGVDMYTRIQGEVAKVGGSTKDALLPMQDYLHQAEEAAKKLGVPLDENTQRMIDQSKELGIWREAAKSTAEKQLEATEKMTIAMDGLVKKLDEFINRLLGIPDVDYDVTEHRRTVDEDGGGGEEGRPGGGGGGRQQFARGGFVSDTNRFPRLPSGDSEQIWATPGELVVTTSQQAAFVDAIRSLEGLAVQTATAPAPITSTDTLAPVIVLVDRGASDAEIIEQTISALPVRIRRNNPSGLRSDMLNALGMASTTWTGK